MSTSKSPVIVISDDSEEEVPFPWSKFKRRKLNSPSAPVRIGDRAQNDETFPQQALPNSSRPIMFLEEESSTTIRLLSSDPAEDLNIEDHGAVDLSDEINWPAEVSQLPDVLDPARHYEDYSNTVLELFPDIQLEYLQEMYKLRMPDTFELEFAAPTVDQIAHMVIIHLAEAENYPKEPSHGSSTKRKQDSESEHEAEDIKMWKAERTTLKNGGFAIYYDREANYQLHREFPRFHSKDIHAAFKETSFAYETLLLLLAEEDHSNRAQMSRSQLVRARVPHIRSWGLEGPTEDARRIVSLEIEAARRHKMLRDEKRRIIQEEKDAELARDMECEAKGEIAECQCCFTDCPMTKVVHCSGDETHFFCITCAKSYTRSLTEQGRFEILCFDGSGCKAGFAYDQKQRFIASDVVRLLDKLEQDNILRISEIDNLAKCPFCDYAAIYPPTDVDKVFRCENEDCKKDSCRLCMMDSHLPLTCAEFHLENGVSARHELEEAMTNALIRICPKCSTPVIKTDGCNKMICTKCRCSICDYCGKNISGAGYQHFADAGRQGVCPTHDDTTKRNADRVKEAEKSAMEKIRQENPDLSDEVLRIRFSEAVQGDPAQLVAHPGQGLHYDGIAYNRADARARIMNAIVHRRAQDFVGQNAPIQPFIQIQQPAFRLPIPAAIMRPYVPQLPPLNVPGNQNAVVANDLDPNRRRHYLMHNRRPPTFP
ncbi:hypothetical protein MMC25_005615 [Agyrium rufum]|nr:hypothetical protein [Agyrium rufum]